MSTYAFEPVEGFPSLPHGMTFGSAANAVAVTDDDHLLVFNRGSETSVFTFDLDGGYIGRWGMGEFTKPHGIATGPDGGVFLIDTQSHLVEKRSVDGARLMTLGAPGGSAPMSGEPFSQPTDVTVCPETHDIFIADGYANARVHRFDADGRHILSWGQPGTGPGQFAIPHSLCFIEPDVLAVCDRENYRIQLFSRDGDYLAEWHSFRPSCIRRGRGPLDGLFVISHLHPPRMLWQMPDIGHSVSVVDQEGRRHGGFGGGTPGYGPRDILSPHMIDVDREGSVYIAETTSYVLRALGFDVPAGVELISLRKWRLTGTLSSPS